MLHALHYHSSGFFIIMSPAEGLHFSALVILVPVRIYIVRFDSILKALKFPVLFCVVRYKFSMQFVVVYMENTTNEALDTSMEGSAVTMI